MSSSTSKKGTSGVTSSFDAFAKVDEFVSKPVLGSEGAASWQVFRKDHKSNRPSAAPKAPLKKLDKLGTGFTTWEDERANEDKVRKEAGQADTGSGYTTFKKKNGSEEAAERKRIKQIEARIRPENQNFFIPAPTFQGWKFDYIFTTRPDRGTGYFWDGADSIKRLRGELIEEEPAPPADNADAEPAKEIKPKKKKRKKNAGPIMVNDPTNPQEQVAAALQKRNQMLGGTADPTLPSGWEAARDPFSGKTYYYCRATGERKWDKPAAPETNEDKKAEEAEKLSDGWKSAADKGTGKTYYYHTNGETKWEKPST
jgi:hypothetical protein